MTIRNRWFLLLTALISVALVAAVACGGGKSSSDKTATAQAGGGGKTATTAGTAPSGELPADAAPADQQKVVLQLPEPEFYDPHRSNFEQDIAVERMLFRALYNLVDDGNGGVKVVPMLADGDPQVNGSVYTVKLKSGLKWSDGSPLTADDVVFGFQRECDPDVASPYQYVLGAGLGDLKGCDALFNNKDAAQKQALIDALGVKKIDDLTVEFTLTKPIPTFKTIWALWATMPSPKAAIEKYGDSWTDPGKIVTSGPYVLTEVVAKDHATLKPNPNWIGQKPAIQEVTLKFIDDLSAAFKAFQNGELQMTQILATDVTVAKGDSTLKNELLIVPSSRITSIEVQMKDPVLGGSGDQDQKAFNLRLAMSRAINRQQLVDAVYDGVHAPATYWVVKGLKGFQGNDAFEDKIGFDLDAAKKALADAGYPNGQGLPTFTLIYRDTPERRNEADFLVNAWKQIGVNVTPQFVDSKARSAAFNSEQFQLFQGGWQLDYPDIENPLVGLFNTGGGNNKYNCSDPDIDAAYEKANKATSEDDRIKAYQEVETLIVTRLCGAIPIYQDSLPFVVSNKLGGVISNGVINAGQPGNWCIECMYVKK
ncbi:MAG TPA: peptide ABC transporter substrate-binding protein [Dehalococcoidia bacterium]|nr:peptide ABC transporter substrate-binding protein [Dehalococcoidia bacterium]